MFNECCDSKSRPSSASKFRSIRLVRRRIFARFKHWRRSNYLGRINQLTRTWTNKVTQTRPLAGRLQKCREVTFYRTERAMLASRQSPNEILVSSDMIVEVYQGRRS